MGTGQNYMRVNFIIIYYINNIIYYILHEGSILHEEKFARGDKIAQRQFCTKAQFFTSYNFAWRVI